MKKYFDVKIAPLSRDLDKKLGVTRIQVKDVQPGPEWDRERYNVPVRVKYYLPEGNFKYLSNRYIRDLKNIGLI